LLRENKFIHKYEGQGLVVIRRQLGSKRYSKTDYGKLRLNELIKFAYSMNSMFYERSGDLTEFIRRTNLVDSFLYDKLCIGTTYENPELN